MTTRAPEPAPEPAPAPAPNVYASPYAIAHPDAYELVALTWQCGVPMSIQLVLVDANDRVIDEDGCQCDMDEPCNNPKCCMDRDFEERDMARLFRHWTPIHPDDMHDHYDGGRLIKGRTY